VKCLRTHVQDALEPRTSFTTRLILLSNSFELGVEELSSCECIRGLIWLTISAMHCINTDLFDEERNRRHFMQQSELSVGPLGVRGIAEYTSVQQRAVHVAHHGPDIPGRVAEARLPLSELDLVHVLLQTLGPLELVRLVERVNATALRDAYVRVGKYELADGGVKSEAMRT
jgi:hypothetical protein